MGREWIEHPDLEAPDQMPFLPHLDFLNFRHSHIVFTSFFNTQLLPLLFCTIIEWIFSFKLTHFLKFKIF